jgi:hypothetical protein
LVALALIPAQQDGQLNKCINIPCKRFRSPDFIGLKSVPDIFAGIHRWWLLAPF